MSLNLYHQRFQEIFLKYANVCWHISRACTSGIRQMKIFQVSVSVAWREVGWLKPTLVACHIKSYWKKSSEHHLRWQNICRKYVYTLYLWLVVVHPSQLVLDFFHLQYHNLSPTLGMASSLSYFLMLRKFRTQHVTKQEGKSWQKILHQKSSKSPCLTKRHQFPNGKSHHHFVVAHSQPFPAPLVKMAWRS